MSEQKACVECQYWSQWDGCCMCSLSEHWIDEVDPEQPACEYFEPEEIEQEEP